MCCRQTVSATVLGESVSIASGMVSGTLTLPFRRVSQEEGDTHDRADHAEAGEQCCDTEGELQGAVRRRTHTELGDKCVSGPAPRLVTSDRFHRDAAVETGPVAAVDVEVARDALGRERIRNRNHLAVAVELGGDGAVVSGEVIGGQHHGLDAVQGVIGDRRHLVHVLSGGVDEWIVGVEIGLHDREVPVVFEQGPDRLRAFDLAAVDELALVVVAELDVLDLAERLERV